MLYSSRVIVAAQRRELEIELQLREQRPARVPSQSEWPKTVDARTGGQQGRTCGKCGKGHSGECRAGRGCQKCGKEGHYAKDCLQAATVQGMRLCYHCNQVGHMRANFPLHTAKPVQAAAPATLRITDGRSDRTEPPKAQCRAFHLTAEEARVAPDVVAGMFLSSPCFVYLLYAYLLYL